MIVSGDALWTGEMQDNIDLRKSIIGFNMAGTSLEVWAASPSCIVINRCYNRADDHYSND